MLDRILSALVALSLAFLVWLYARTRDQEVLDNVPLPVQITLAHGQMEQYSLEVPEPCQVPVSFTGTTARLKELRGMLQRGEIPVSITLSVPEERQRESRYAETVRIDAADVHAPPGILPMIVEGRNRIPVTLHRLVERRLPVRFEPAAEEHVDHATVDPPTVLVRGPEEILDHTRTVPTQPCLVPPQSDTGSSEETCTLGAVSLVQELEGQSIRVTPDTVTVFVTRQPRKKVYALELPIHFLCPPNFRLRPRFEGERPNGTITVTVEGPPAEDAPAVTAYIDLSHGKFKEGLHQEPLRVQLPKDCELVPSVPPLISFQLDPPDLAVEGPSAPPEPSPNR